MRRWTSWCHTQSKHYDLFVHHNTDGSLRFLEYFICVTNKVMFLCGRWEYNYIQKYEQRIFRLTSYKLQNDVPLIHSFT